MFVQMISSESLNLLLLNLVLRYIIMSQIVFQNDWFAVFKIKVTMKDHVIKIWLFSLLSELLILGLKSHDHKVDFLVKRFDCCVVIKIKVMEKVQNSSDC